MSKKEFFSFEPIEKVLLELHTSLKGLSQKEALNRLKQYGYNTIGEKKEASLFWEFFSHFKNPLVLILLAAAGTSAYLGEMKNFVIIFLMILGSVLLDFFEEHSANLAAKKLKEKVSQSATVIRNSKKQEIKASEVCIGDIIFLSAGDLVPADARIIEVDDFLIDESALTGEAFPVEKKSSLSTNVISETFDFNIVYLGSHVIKGTALAVVFQTGSSTEFGHIAKTLFHKEEKSEFELGVTKFGFFIMRVILAMVLFIFLGDAFMKRDILQSFIFAIAIAVGVTPELLPMILSINLALVAKKMGKAGVIVKKLSAIPNFGSMNILCTDKTGTLTENQIQLILYTDIFGNTNEKVFLYTYINSSYQTGVKNPLDKAVLEYKTIPVSSYQKTEEIPFDFNRKMMSIAVKGPEGCMLITKGAPEAIIERCSYYTDKDKILPWDDNIRTISLEYYEKLSAQGYRVLALAVKPDLPEKIQYTNQDEKDLILIGFVSFFDPAKKDVAKVLQALTNHGIEVKVLTGDNEIVTQKVCQDIGMEIKGVLIGKQIRSLTDDALAIKAQKTTIFARFSPDEKKRIISVLRSSGNVVGYMGDGINDAPALKKADVGISVNSAVDVAKETAEIILTKKQLKSVIDGVVEGRKAFGNTMKYIMMALSSNFGNMFSVMGAIFYLPFLPMLPIQILLNNFIYDFSQITIPSDKVDASWLQKPRKWNLHSVKKFMWIFGPISSLFDFMTFFILFSVFHLTGSTFQTGWFMESLATQTLVIHIIRTREIPIIQSRASKLLTFSTFACVLTGWLLPFTPLGEIFQFSPLPIPVLIVIVVLVICYLLLVEGVKRIYYRNEDM
jgi:P-type Mg2+ transporter